MSSPDRWQFDGDADNREHEATFPERWAQIQENQARIREIIEELTEMQSDIARPDAAS